MNIQKKSLRELIPAGYNPRLDLGPGDPEYEKLKRSIDEFGYVEPIIWNEQTGLVVGGHQRLKILQDRGETEAEVVVVNLSPEKEKALNLALNKVSGDWDDEKLSALLYDLSLDDMDLSLTGFDSEEIEAAIKGKLEDDVHEDDFSVSDELKRPAFSRPGDLWKLGRHVLICGDSTRAETYEQLLHGEQVDLLLTDPPYNVAYEGTAGTIQNDNQAAAEFERFLQDVLDLVRDCMKPGAAFYIWHASRTQREFENAINAAGFTVRQQLIWNKSSLVIGRQDYQWKHEPCFYGWKDGSHFFTTDRTQTTVSETEQVPDFGKMKKPELVRLLNQLYSQPTTVLDEKKPARNGDHPTMKPIKLMARQILNSSMKGFKVLDPFGGSGSTLMACEQTGRTCYTVELDEKYCDVIVNRYVEEKGTTETVSLLRDGRWLAYEDVQK